MRMDVLMQSTKTALYLKRDLSWTPALDAAHAFMSSGEAIDFVYAHHLKDVQLVLFFRELKHSLIVPFQIEAPPEASLVTPNSKPDRPSTM